MIKGVFRRLFGTFREGAILHAKFVVGGNGGTTATFTLKSNTSGSNYQLQLARTGVGLLTLTLPAVRQIAVLDIQEIVAAGADVSASYQNFGLRPAFNEASGTIGIRVLTNAGIAGGEMAFAVGDEVHVTLYVDK